MTLGLRAACSKQMPACEDSHQSSHTEADCAGSLFHSNKGTSAEHCRLVQTEPAGAQREVKRRRGRHQGAPSQRREWRSGLGNETAQSRSHLRCHSRISCHPGFPCLPCQRPVALLTGDRDRKPGRNSAILDSEASLQEPEPHCLISWKPQAPQAQGCWTHVARKRP